MTLDLYYNMGYTMPDSHVRFDEQGQTSTSYYRKQNGSALANLLVKSGVAKDQRSAEILLIGIVIVCLLLIAAFYFLGAREEALPELTPEQRLHEL